MTWAYNTHPPEACNCCTDIIGTACMVVEWRLIAIFIAECLIFKGRKMRTISQSNHTMKLCCAASEAPHNEAVLCCLKSTTQWSCAMLLQRHHTMKLCCAASEAPHNEAVLCCLRGTTQWSCAMLHQRPHIMKLCYAASEAPYNEAVLCCLRGPT